jgi:hypothetical protein
MRKEIFFISEQKNWIETSLGVQWDLKKSVRNEELYTTWLTDVVNNRSFGESMSKA